MNLFPATSPNILEIHQVFLRILGLVARKILLLKTAKHSKARRFSARQEKKARQGFRLTPTALFWQSIAGKNPLWSEYIPMGCSPYGEYLK